ncbi:MAG TPA: helix-turn-helix domain-containing protein [Vicinamibacteria bacterium]|nr:helix-turn-helix domain-containing protein [Vicinamibacteria bacterium]
MTSWRYAESRPPGLSRYVDFLWHFQGPTEHRRKRILPNGKVELLVNLGEPYRTVEGHGIETVKEGCVSGMQSGPMVLEQPPRQDVLGMRLRPAGAYALLAAPLRETSGLVVGLEDVFGSSARELVDRCHEAPGVAERFRILTGWIRRRIVEARVSTPEVAWSAARIDGTHGEVPILELRRETGFSAARLASLFREEIGLKPKLYARVVRFRRVLRMLQDGKAPLADVALDAAFYDQPHMTGEFRELSGMTPKEFLRARHPVGDGTTAADLRSA